MAYGPKAQCWEPFQPVLRDGGGGGRFAHSLYPGDKGHPVWQEVEKGSSRTESEEAEGSSA